MSNSIIQYLISKFEKVDFTNLYFSFSTDSELNQTNFTSCLYFIEYVYQVYKKSLEEIIDTQQLDSFGKKHFGFDKTLFVETYISIPQPSQTICGLIGILPAQKLMIIAIKGSLSTNDVSLGIESISQTISLNPFPSDSTNTIGAYTFMPNMNENQIKKRSKVGKGWYDYVYTIGSKKAQDDCYYDQKCQVLPKKQYSKIENECVDPKNLCSKPDKTMAQQVFDIIDLYPDYDIIFTGHSLGSCGVTLLAYNLSLSGKKNRINSIYLYGSPKIGNKIFVNQFNSFQIPVYNIINSKDIFTKLPLNLFQVSNIINFQSSKNGIIENHDPITYVKAINFS